MVVDRPAPRVIERGATEPATEEVEGRFKGSRVGGGQVGEVVDARRERRSLADQANLL
jgi:hypothetical protein